jgi:hypothetical protein
MQSSLRQVNQRKALGILDFCSHFLTFHLLAKIINLSTVSEAKPAQADINSGIG